MYLVLLCDIKGVPVGYDLAGPKTGQKRDAATSASSPPPSTTSRAGFSMLLNIQIGRPPRALDAYDGR